ncbi:MAG: response regulator [Pseudomonadota bacterium]
MSDPALERLKRRAQRERSARKLAEELLERKSAELYESGQALARLNATLEQRVEARTEALREARDEALAATRVKSEFLATMSHEIRTPMNGVLGTLELLRDAGLGPEQLELVTIALSSSEQLLTVLNDILDMSKFEAGKLELEKTPINLHELIEEVGVVMGRSAQAKSLELAYEVAADVPGAVCGDPVRLRQVLTNLLSNAIKFTAEGEVVIEVAMRSNHVYFAVADTGPGIEPASAARLFEPFTQADSTTTRRFGGTGLGLSICRALVELMQGEIGVESVPGEGSRFWFTARFDTAQEEATREDGADLRGRRMLVVDDNRSNRHILTRNLQGLGIEVYATESVDAAIVILDGDLAGQPPDAVLVDWQMPERDGLALIRHLNDLQEFQFTRTVLLSSIGLPASAEEREGIDLALTKPVRHTQLRSALAGLFGAQPELSASASASAPAEALLLPTDARILLAEDDPTNRLVAIGMLARLGVKPDIAQDGLEAVCAARKLRYDVILMDGQMPQLDGFEATLEIRRQEQEAGLPPVPIIALTASALASDRERCTAVGMTDFLSKPVNRQALGDMLVEHLQVR